MKTSMGTQ